MEAWHEDNISYPYALNISHVDINVTVRTSNEELVPLDNIIVQPGKVWSFSNENSTTAIPYWFNINNC